MTGLLCWPASSPLGKSVTCQCFISRLQIPCPLDKEIYFDIYSVMNKQYINAIDVAALNYDSHRLNKYILYKVTTLKKKIEGESCINIQGWVCYGAFPSCFTTQPLQRFVWKKSKNPKNIVPGYEITQSSLKGKAILFNHNC